MSIKGHVDLYFRNLRRSMRMRYRLQLFNDWSITRYPQPKSVTDTILVVRFDAIGDFVIWLDSAKEFRSLYPGKKIVLCANSVWVGLAECFPYWDEVISVDLYQLGNNLSYRFKFFMNIRKQRFQIAIQPTFSRDHNLSDSLIRASGAAQRIGSKGNFSTMTSQEKNVSDKWYTRLISASADPLMELKRNAEFIRGLGSVSFSADLPKIEKLLELPTKLTVSEPYFIIFPGASRYGKMWPTSRFAEVINSIHNLFGWKVVLCGSLREKLVCDEVIKLSGHSKAINLAGMTSLPEFVEVVRGARLLIGNDTSAIHIASATATPSVCILGGWDFGRFLPYDIENNDDRPLPQVVFTRMDCYYCGWECVYPLNPNQTAPCITGVNVDQVVAACNQVIKQWSTQ